MSGIPLNFKGSCYLPCSRVAEQVVYVQNVVFGAGGFAIELVYRRYYVGGSYWDSMCESLQRWSIFTNPDEFSNVLEVLWVVPPAAMILRCFK